PAETADDCARLDDDGIEVPSQRGFPNGSRSHVAQGTPIRGDAEANRWLLRNSRSSRRAELAVGEPAGSRDPLNQRIGDQEKLDLWARFQEGDSLLSPTHRAPRRPSGSRSPRERPRGSCCPSKAPSETVLS